MKHFLILVTFYFLFLYSDVICKERLKSSKLKYLDLIFKEVDDLILNQNSAIEGVRFQSLFEDRFPYEDICLNLLNDKQQARLKKMFFDRTPFS